MLNLQGLEKSFGGQELFHDVSLSMNPGERLGLVGRNGSGKSTLFRILLGEVEADRGQVRFPKHYRVGHLEQHLHFTRPTILEEACLGLPEGEEEMHYKAERILFGLGFGDEDLSRSPQEFSGGFQIRINLAKVLVSEPNLLLLDEPTNYLDIVSIRWMTRFLRQWRNELILISHDRDFMDGVTTHTAILHRGRLRKVQGGTEKLYAQILQEEEIHEKTRLNREKKLQKEMAFIERFRAKATKASAVQSRLKRLEKMPSLEKLAQLDHLDFSFHDVPFEADRMLELKNLSFHFEEKNPLILDLSLSVKAGDRIAVIGKNGKGKSTLLRLMAGELSPVSGEIDRHPQAKTGYFGQTNIQRLNPSLTIEKEIASVDPDLSVTAVRNICGTMMFSGDQAEKKISVLSGGEKSRVLLGKILAQPCNLLLLDEPTNHLDMESIEALLDSLEEFAGAVVIVTHSEMILDDLVTKLIVFHRGRAEYFPGTYEEFLEKFGWEDEGEAGGDGKSKAASPGINKKEFRKRRSEIITERSRVLTPLKKEIEKIESGIMGWEAELAKAQEGLAQASEGRDGAAAAERSRKIQALQEDIEKAFERLAQVHTQHEEENKKFEELLARIDASR
jgi:ATP-binding cassette, subfamily F, member 3